MQWSDIPHNPSSRTLRQFGMLCFIISGAFGVWYGLQNKVGYAISLCGGAIVLGSVGWTNPQALRRIYVGWLVLVFPISWLVSNLILAGIFYGLITPLAFAFRLPNRDVLARRRQPEVDSYWAPTSTVCDASSYFRQF